MNKRRPFEWEQGAAAVERYVRIDHPSQQLVGGRPAFNLRTEMDISRCCLLKQVDCQEQQSQAQWVVW